MKSAQKIGLFGLIASSAFVSTAMGVVPWTPSSGNSILFSYAGGEANDGDFGNPTLSPNTFNFSPTTFFAGGGAPNPNTNTDTLTVVLTVNPGQVITSVRIREVGTRTSSTGGFPSVTGTLWVKDLQNGTFGQQQKSLVVNYTATTWTAEVWMTGMNFTEGQQLSISMTNNLTGLSTKRIDKTGVTVEVLPAPGVLGLAGFAALGLVRRRR